MSLLSLIFLLAVTSVTRPEATCKTGIVAEVIAVRFEASDSRPAFCEIRIESSGPALTFGIEDRQTTKKNCETEWAVHDEIQFCVVGQDILVKRAKGKELKGRLLPSHPSENRK
jgi:hypothetical protein